MNKNGEIDYPKTRVFIKVFSNFGQLPEILKVIKNSSKFDLRSLRDDFTLVTINERTPYSHVTRT